MFLFKKIVAALLAPLPLSIVAILLGLFLACYTRRKRAGHLLILIALTTLTLFSITPVSNTLVASLENQYPSYQPQATAETAHIRYVVVLGGGHISDPAVPVTSQINPSTLARVTEGVRLHKMLPSSRLVLSGGKVFDDQPEAETMRQVAIIMGVKEENIVLDRRSRDTREQAINIKSLTRESGFILVTSAMHMPRSMALFEHQGLTPIPAPTHHRARKQVLSGPAYFLPNANALLKSEQITHEYIGMAWAWLRGKI